LNTEASEKVIEEREARGGLNYKAQDIRRKQEEIEVITILEAGSWKQEVGSR
jgi:hypothetical protein